MLRASIPSRKDALANVRPMLYPFEQIGAGGLNI